MNDSRPRLLVLDVMPLLYRGHFALLKRPRLTSGGFNSSALFVFANIVREMLARPGVTHAAFVMDASPTFRHEMYPAYKAQREKLPEEIAASLEPAEAFARALRVPFLKVPGFEADDLMGTLSAMGDAAGFDTWLVSPDKDMAQLVSEHTFLVRPARGGGPEPDEIYDVAKVREEWGVSSPSQMIDYLGMAGDSADNIPGLPGVGPKTAKELLLRYGSLEGVLAHASEIKGKTGERIAASADIARLSRNLAEIRCDAPVGVTLDDLLLREPSLPEVEAFCRKYEFFKLLARYTGRAEESEGAVVAAATSDAPNVPLETAATRPHAYRAVTTEADLRALARRLAAAREFAFDTETTGLRPREDAIVGLSVAMEPGEAWYVPICEDCAAETNPPPVAPRQPDLFAFADAKGSSAPPSTAAAPRQMDFFSLFEEAPDRAAPAKETAPRGLSVALVRDILGPVFADPAIGKIGHNAKFDLHVLKRIGIRVEGPISDSMLAHYVLDPTMRHGMDPLAREYLRYDPIPIETLIGSGEGMPRNMKEVDPQAILEYAAEDADVTLRLHRVLEPIVRRDGAWRAYDEAEKPLVRVLADMEEAGIRIDTDALLDYGRALGAEMDAAVAKIHALAGEAFNVDSPRQLGRVLFEKLGLPVSSKTSTGHLSTAEDVLNDLRDKHEIIPLILDYRACAKLQSTYAEKLPTFVDPRDGRVHTTFNQALTETGRLSSDNPNLQNIPIRTDRGKPIRAALLAGSDDHLLLSADYSQIELRMVAHLSRDEALLQAFRSGADIHRETAARVYGISPEEVTKEQRSFCKQVNFGIIYGISAFGLAQRLGCGRSRADELIRAYFEMFPGVRRYLDETIAFARANGYVATILGRRRPLRNITSRNATVRASAERNATNTPVQGSAADLIKLAMVRVHGALREKGLAAKLVLQVHDELVLDVPKAEIATVSSLVRDAMENALPLAVPLRVDVGTGPNWLAAH